MIAQHSNVLPTSHRSIPCNSSGFASYNFANQLTMDANKNSQQYKFAVRLDSAQNIFGAVCQHYGSFLPFGSDVFRFGFVSAVSVTVQSTLLYSF